MLPDFPLPVPGLSAGPRVLLARDVPTAVFFDGFPPTVPMTECFLQESPAGQARLTAQLETWADGLLVRAVVQPRLTPELVQRLGPARDPAVLAYLRTVGWLDDEDLDGPAGELPAAAPAPAPQVTRAGLRVWVIMPPPGLRGALRLLAAKGRVLPSLLWALPISEFLFNWRLLCRDELLAPAADEAWG